VPQSYRIIDSHQHVFWHGGDDAAHIADMDAHGIDLAWLLTWEIPPYPAYPDNITWAETWNPARTRADGSHPGIVLDDLLLAASRYSDRYLLGYCPDPQLPHAVALFEAAVRMHGVRICGEWKCRMPFDDPRCLELFHAAGRAKAPVVLHLDVPYLRSGEGQMVYQPRWYGGTIDNLERALIACPETNFIGHAPGFWREISGDAATDPKQYPSGPLTPGGRLHGLFDRHPNLHADLSANSGLTALRRDPAHAREFLATFADRLLFGRDDYGGGLPAFLKTLDLPTAVAAKIYRENALKLVDPAAVRPKLPGAAWAK
jgi:predicted TIM-barrel fold metal-dependent hydrolase